VKSGTLCGSSSHAPGSRLLGAFHAAVLCRRLLMLFVFYYLLEWHRDRGASAIQRLRAAPVKHSPACSRSIRR